MYKSRSKIVHGETTKINNNQVKELENKLRQSIILGLEKPELFSIESLENIPFYKDLEEKNEENM